MILRLTVKPRPKPTLRVVKNGAQAFCIASGVKPVPFDLLPKDRQGADVGRDGVILVVTSYHLAQPFPLFVDRCVAS